jgi:glutamate-1-semialdehyde 2,1-aminomutase
MHDHGRALQRAISSTAAECGIQLAICGSGTVFSVHWGVSEPPIDYRQTLRSDQSAYTSFRMLMLEHGVYLLPDGRWYVGAMHGEEQLDAATTAIRKSMEKLR